MDCLQELAPDRPRGAVFAPRLRDPYGPLNLKAIDPTPLTPLDEADLSTIAERAQENKPVIEGMIIGNPSQEAVDNISTDLSIVPGQVLKSVADRGTKIVALKEGESYLDSGLTSEVDPSWIEQNAGDLRNRFEEIQARETEIMLDKWEIVNQIQDKVDAEKRGQASSGAGSGEGLGVREELNRRRAAFVAARQKDIEVREQLPPEVDSLEDAARVRSMVAGNTEGSPMAMAPYLMPRTVEQFAEMSGARTPEEIEEYVQLTVKLNEGKLGENPGKDSWLFAGRGILVPGYSFVDGKRVFNEELGMDAILKEPGMGGVFSARMNRIVVNERYLPDPAPEFGHERVILHEFGHAVDAHLRYDEETGKAHELLLYRYNAESLISQKGRFVTDYARGIPTGEDFAENFEAFFTRNTNDSYEYDFSRGANTDNLRQVAPEMYEYLSEVLGLS